MEELYKSPETEVEIVDDTADENEDFRFSITSYGADYTVDSIITRIEKDKIFVPPFQRKYVWTQVQASRFIESLILGLPVPGIFLSQEKEKNRLLIIDGQQRILSIANFYKGVFGERKFRLTGVQPDLEGKTYEELNEADQNRLDDSVLHATVVKQDSPSDDESSIYMIFERLNTGGTPLQPQEIRACIYYGRFNELLADLTTDPNWRNIFGRENKRMKEQELILRFFALYFRYNDYKKGLKAFLNTFMGENRELQLYDGDTLVNLFHQTILTVNGTIGNNAFRISNKLNAAIFDSIMIGICHRITTNSNAVNTDKLLHAYSDLLSNPEYKSYIESSTSIETSVKGRIELAIRIFSGI